MEEPGRSADGDHADAPAPAVPDPELCNDVVCRTELYTVEALPDVTASDLVAFVPHPPTLVTEPVGAALVGMPANFVASASAHSLAGRLFGYDVVVRFLPAGFVFDHGDGTSSRSDSGGTSWNALSQTTFTPTATSHVYRERGTVTASVTVLYRAEVDFGGGRWRPVTGLVRAAGGAQQIRVVEAHTALVGRTCRENPGAPGC